MEKTVTKRQVQIGATYCHAGVKKTGGYLVGYLWSGDRNRVVLVQKNPLPSSLWLLLVLGLLFHPVWNFWWIEKLVARRLAALVALAVVLAYRGVSIWPKPVAVSDAQLRSDAKALAQ